MDYHGNSYKNEKLHHLYAIMDSELDDVFKFGITDDSIEFDGLPKRVREQFICSTALLVIHGFMPRCFKATFQVAEKQGRLNNSTFGNTGKKTNAVP
jgi:hypothetical protein